MDHRTSPTLKLSFLFLLSNIKCLFFVLHPGVVCLFFFVFSSWPLTENCFQQSYSYNIETDIHITYQSFPNLGVLINHLESYEMQNLTEWVWGGVQAYQWGPCCSQTKLSVAKTSTWQTLDPEKELRLLSLTECVKPDVKSCNLHRFLSLSWNQIMQSITLQKLTAQSFWLVHLTF